MGGAERLCLDIISELVGQADEVMLILLENQIEYNFDLNTIPHYISDAKVSLNPFKKESASIKELKNVVNHFSPDIVHTHLFYAEFLWKSLEVKIPSFFHIHDNIKAFEFNEPFFSKEGIIKSIVYYKYKKWIKNNPGKYLCISKDTTEYIKSTIDKEGKDTLLLHNAIEFEKFSCSNKRSLSSIEMITIGSLVPKKAQSFLLDVVYELKKLTKNNLSLKILGDGQERKNLEHKIIDLGLTGEVQLLGKVNNVEKYLQDSNCYIHGAYEEPFGLVLIEAMAASLPVVSTDGGGNRDIVLSNENGFLLKQRDSKRFAEIILEIFEDKSLYERLSTNAHNFSKDYDIKKYVDKLLDIYKA